MKWSAEFIKEEFEYITSFAKSCAYKQLGQLKVMWYAYCYKQNHKPSDECAYSELVVLFDAAKGNPNLTDIFDGSTDEENKRWFCGFMA